MGERGEGEGEGEGRERVCLLDCSTGLREQCGLHNTHLCDACVQPPYSSCQPVSVFTIVYVLHTRDTSQLAST